MSGGQRECQVNKFLIVCECVFVFSLIAPVQADGDVSLDVPTLVLGQVTRKQLPPQVDELHHHMADLVE